MPEDWDAGRPIVNIDHHASNTGFGAINWVVGDASSSAELVYFLLKAWGRPIEPLCASLLYAGIHTDTSGFSLPNTSKSALAAAAQLDAERQTMIVTFKRGDGYRFCLTPYFGEYEMERSR